MLHRGTFSNAIADVRAAEGPGGAESAGKCVEVGMWSRGAAYPGGHRGRW